MLYGGLQDVGNTIIGEETAQRKAERSQAQWEQAQWDQKKVGATNDVKEAIVDLPAQIRDAFSAAPMQVKVELDGKEIFGKTVMP